ncbi:membrane protein [Acrocarpospora phusangensis]|uniref:Membrane protein n=1 Tax=Acrocarpospora phusangensis TaxID=1070424 RepID=A0A919QK23_9ACTN|nr:glycosyltransferase family 87 protein [Acrocarpospora phusangensis]GIH29574.1 membrane protein [Acrocarpospora phusangensis]
MRYALPVWVITRAVLFLAATQVIPVGLADSFTNDVRLYGDWSTVLLGGQFPEGDEKWQYPPFAAVPMLAPHLLPWSYQISFYVIALLCDLAILLLIHRFSTRYGTGPAAVWAWTIGAALLGPILISRYDLMVTLVAVAALTASRDAYVRGILIGVGLSIKVWPVALLVGLRRWRELLTGAGAALGATVVACGAAALVMPHALDFLTNQQERGLQVESLAGTPFALARALGWWGGFTSYQHGAMELVGDGIETATQVSVIATPVALLLLLVWWLRATPTETTYYDAAFTTVLFLVLTSRVLSPQYLIWLIGIAAVTFAVHGSSQRPAAWLLLAAMLLTGIMYPWVEQDYSWDGELPGTLLLVLRNLLLLAAAIVSFVRLWQSSVPQRARRKPVPAI